MADKIRHFYEFDGYRLSARPPVLWRGGQLVPTTPKVLETLVLLVEKKGEIVSRDELLETVWRETSVEEGNINYTVSLLRKVLGKELVQTIPRRGYRFTAEVREVTENGKANVVAGNAEMVADAHALRDARAVTDAHAPQTAGVVAPKAKPRRILFATLLLGILLLTVSALWWQFSNKAKLLPNKSIKSVAVLPLRSLNDDETGRAFALGLTDLLISRLGSLNRFAVRPLDAVEKYAKEGRDALKAGAEVKVDAVLEGTFQSVGERLQVNVRLIDVRDGAQLWAADFDETEGDVFKLQDKLALQVANSLSSKMIRQEESSLARKQTGNAEAYRAYARGRALLDRKNPDVFDRAVEEFQRASTLDPTFSLAYTGLADALMVKGNAAQGKEADELYTRARLYVQKALELGGESAEIYTILGRIKRARDWDWEGAESDFMRAIELNPNHAEAHRYYAQMLSSLGRHDEALAEINRAIEINPISMIIMMAQFSILEGRGEYAEALKHAEQVYRFEAENPLAKRALATFLYHTRADAKVIELCEHLTAKDERHRFAFLSLLASSYLRTNQHEKADAALRQLEQLAQTDTKALYSLAMNYAEQGRTDDAIWALQRCFDLREERIVWLNVEPRLASLRNDSRFQVISQRMRLKQD